jgi:hypothetical protein
MNENPGTSPQLANATYSSPRSMRITSGGGSNIPVVQVFPEIRGGTCEKCGTLDRTQPGQYQYKLCEHYRSMDIKCVFCPQTKDVDEVIRNSVLKVFSHPYRQGELVIWCQSFPCLEKLKEMFPFLKNN